MAASTGPMLAIGAITVVNQSVFNAKPIDLRVVAGTGLLAIVASLAEQALGPKIVTGVAYVGLVAVLLTRVDPKMPSPAESALAWWDGKK